MARGHQDINKSFSCRPPKGWSYTDEQIMNEGVSFNAVYVGCTEVFTSMKEMDFQTRSMVAKECINRVRESASIRTPKKRRVDKNIKDSIADKPCLEHSGANVIVNISSTCLTLTCEHTGEIIAQHEMPKISFASSGDADAIDFIAYVAKDLIDWRACYVLECCKEKAQTIIATIGQAFELRYREFYRTTLDPKDDCEVSDEEQNLKMDYNTKTDAVYYYNDLPGKMPPDLLTPNSLKKSNILAKHQQQHQSRDRLPSNLIDLSPSTDHDYVNDDKHSSSENNLSANSSSLCGNNGALMKDVFDIQRYSIPADVQRSELLRENWYHGAITRRQAESLLKCDGDFLVRDTHGTPGQYVLTGMQLSQPKHLLLIDPEGIVRTKSRVFESISHIINYHWTNALPIISSESTLVLRTPIIRTTVLPGQCGGKNY